MLPRDSALPANTTPVTANRKAVEVRETRNQRKIMRQAPKPREEERKDRGEKEVEVHGKQRIRLRAEMLLVLSAESPAHQNS